MAKILSVLVTGFLLTSSVWADEAADRKKELAQLKNQTQQKEAELKKYKEQEKKISKEMTDLQQKQAQAERLKSKVEKDLTLVEQNLVSIEDKRAALERSIPMWQGVVWQETQQHYLTPRCEACPMDTDLETDIFLQRMLAHKATFAVTLLEETDAAKKRFAVFTQQNKNLQEQNSKLQKERTVISKSYQKKQQDLDSTQRKVSQVRKELDDLTKSAAELNKLLASFERKRQESAKKQNKTGQASKTEKPKIPVPAHSLPWPVQGKVISSFGKEYRADLNTWIFRDGIKIAAPSGTPVRASAQGSVIYAGPFRSYGNVVIMDHGKGFFTIYGFLKEMSVSVGDKLAEQGKVGLVGKDTQASSGTGQSAVYFEIRQGTTAVDPLDWLK